MKLESEDEMNLENKLIELKEHVQYMQNMLAMGQTLMDIDHATLTDLFNDCQPAQKNSLDYAERELATLRAQNAEMVEALELCYIRIYIFGMESLRDPQITQKLNNECIGKARALLAKHKESK